MSTRSDQRKDAAEHGLYDPAYEHDACGVGFVASVKGQASHEIVTQALQILKNLDHRGAVGADPLCGDGAGILIQIPDAFFRAEMAKQNILLPPAGDYGVGMIFLPREHASRRACEQELERVVKAEGQVVLGWRDVPVDTTIRMSKTVLETAPVIRQIFIGRGPDVMVPNALERKLYVIRKLAGHKIQALKLSTAKSSMCLQCRQRPLCTKVFCWQIRSVPTTKISMILVSSAPLLWFISVSRPTHSRAGNLPTRTA